MEFRIAIEHYDVDEVFYWCKEYCCKGKWKFRGVSGLHRQSILFFNLVYTFEDENDLMIFRLRWGGELIQR